jgi:hypothetical protein
MTEDTPPARIDVVLVANGKYHDFDFARLELLKLLAEHPNARVKVAHDYTGLDEIRAASLLVTYTCDLRPTEEQSQAIADWVAAGGRWLALHGTNAALEPSPEGFKAPRCMPTFVKVLGSQFIAHPPIAPYLVELTDPTHPLVAGVESFETDDELYLSELHDEDQLLPLLHTHYTGDARGFYESDWTTSDRHLVMYLRPWGEGMVLYNTLGHCRGHWDMPPLVDYYPRIERCSWGKPQYYELLRRGIRWGLALDHQPQES